MTPHPDPTTAAVPRRRGRPPGRTAPATATATAPAALLADSLSMTLRTACAVTDLSRDAMYDALRPGPDGEPPAVRSFTVGARRYVETASLRAYIERLASEPTTIRRGPNTRSPDHPAAPAPGAKSGISGPLRAARGMDFDNRNGSKTRNTSGSGR